MGTETPVGYRLVRVGVRGRVPTLHARAPEDLTTRQKYDLRYREKHRAKLLAYHREYYRKENAKQGKGGVIVEIGQVYNDVT